MRIITLLLAIFMVFTPAYGDTIKVVALVNDQIISSMDLNERAAMVMGTTGIPDTAENRARLLPQILNQLIDEKLEMQEAAQDGITISDEKLHQGIAQIEKQSGKPPGSLETFLESKGVSKLSFFAQARAQMAWSEIILKKVRPKVHISDQEIARYTKHKTTTGGPVSEVMISAIQLPVDSPANEAAVHKVADNLAEEIRAGASFEAVAAQFSSSTNGTKSSEPFWVELSQMNPAIVSAISKTSRGSITDPVRTESGYQIIKLLDTRQQASAAPVADNTSAPRVELAYKQIILTPTEKAAKQKPDILMGLASKVSAVPGGCNDTPMQGKGDLKAFNFAVTFQRGLTSNLPPALTNVLSSLSVGSTSQPIATPQGIRIFTLCERTELPPVKIAPEVAAETARQAIYEEKLQLEAQKFLRNLRREAFIEIRGI